MRSCGPKNNSCHGMKNGLLNDFFTGGDTVISFPLQAESTAFFNRRASVSDPVPANYQIAYNAFIYWAKNTLSNDGVNSIWTESDVIQLGETYSVDAALQNLKSSAFGNGVIDNGSYVGQFSAGEGIQGSSANSFRVKTGYNPGDGARTYKYVLNNAAYGMAVYTDTNGDESDIWATTDPGGIGSFVTIRRLIGVDYQFRTDSVTPIDCNPYSYCNFAKRYIVNGANGHQTFLNGYLMADVAKTTTHVQNSEFKRFAFYQGTQGNYSNRLQGHFWAGSANVLPNIIEGLIFRYFTSYVGTTRSKQKNRILFLGDGRINGQNTTVTPLSYYGESARRTAEQLNGGAGTYTGGWVVSANGYGNRLVSTMLTEMTTQVNPWRNVYLEKDYAVVDCVTSSVEGNPSYTAATGFAEVMTVINNLRSMGIQRIIYITPIDIQWTGWSGGQTQAGWNAWYAAFMLLINAEFSIIRSDLTPYARQNSNGVFCTVSQLDSRLANAHDTTYFNLDIAHLNQTGYRALADSHIVPIIQATS